MKIRQTPEDSARLLSAAACFLRGAVVLPIKISLIRPTEWSEILSPEPFPVAEFSYPPVTARELSIKLQPLC
ncbi:hypothetical protein AIX81_24745 [Salmonella enterica]|nr:hypothetical protein [Salmonella enterica]